ncbi:hypothetical protein [Paenimyroides baculatum]|uniref:Uncharacterized protein n=1 Tax=Paenimyroides baculatum TaxID=2608000 RepID=A0A5M6C9T4_9FLAO|nr:hypothetical protein [Paenimyroides baculatum]KAA5531876.1 hypothetical protein F0460_14770 [Paenimyroides baculatum]
MTKKILMIGLVLISLNSCKDRELEDLKLENESLKNELFTRNQAVYTWTVIECKIGAYTIDNGYGKKGFFKGTDDVLYWSEIEMFNNFNEDIKYQLQDQLEKKCRNRYGMELHSIQKKETFAFNSYAEASQFKDSVTNGNKNK